MITTTIRSIGGDNVVTQAEAGGLVPVVGTSDAFGGTVTILVGGEERGTAVVAEDGTWQAEVDFFGASGRTLVTASVSDGAGGMGSDTETALVDSGLIRVSTANGQDLLSPHTQGDFTPTVSADGRFVAFASGDGLPTSLPADPVDIYVKDVRTGAVTLVSKGLGGEPSNGNSSAAAISADGRFVAFLSDATNLAPGDTAAFPDVFVAELATGNIQRISIDGRGAADRTYLGHAGFAPALSEDGRFLAFVKYTPGSASEVFVKDLQTGEVELVSEPGHSGQSPSISADGRYVAFLADFFTGADRGDILVRDLQTGTLTLASVSFEGFRASGVSLWPQISDDGTRVAFASVADNLVPDGLRAYKAYVRDLGTETTSLVSPPGPESAPSVQFYGSLDISGDGRFVAYATRTGIDPRDVNRVQDIYVRDLETGSQTLVSSGRANFEGLFDGWYPSLSENGDYVTFVSLQDMTPDDTNGTFDVYLRRLNAASITLDPIAGDDEVTAAEASAAFKSLQVGGTSGLIGGEVTVAVDGATLGTAIVAGDGTWSTTIDILALSRATHSLTATVLDGLGFSSSDGSIITILPGARTLVGTPGDEVMIGGVAPAGDPNTLDGGDGLDTASYAGTAGTVYADLRSGGGHVDGVLTDVFQNLENLIGGSGDDLLVGSDGANVLNGGGGQDQLHGMGGDDTLVGGTAAGGGVNQLFGGEGIDMVDYSTQAGALYVDLRGGGGYVAGTLAETLNGVENVLGGSGNDLLVGNEEVNVLRGGGGVDQLFGMGGDDVLVGGTNPAGQYNQLFGDAGSDTASYEGAASAVYADLVATGGYDAATKALLDAYSLIENLTGGSAADVLAGDAGANSIRGGAGADILYGRGGADTFVYGAASESNLTTGYDTIADFETGLDHLDLSAFGLNGSQILIASGGGSTSLYADTDSGTAGYELAISLVGANAIQLGDIVF